MAEERASDVPRAIRFFYDVFRMPDVRNGDTPTRCVQKLHQFTVALAGADGWSLRAFAPQRLADGFDEDIGVAHLLRDDDDGGERLLLEERRIAHFRDDDFWLERGHHFERFRSDSTGATAKFSFARIVSHVVRLPGSSSATTTSGVAPRLSVGRRPPRERPLRSASWRFSTLVLTA